MPILYVDYDKKELTTKDGLVSMVDSEYTRRMAERKPFELLWRLNIAFIEGNQFLEIDPGGQIIREVPKLYYWQERECFNQIAPIVETRIARLARMRPILKARPATNSERDVRSAKVSSHLLRNFYYDEGIQHRMSEIYGWLEAMGTCLIKNSWNPDKGELIGLSVISDETEDGEQRHMQEEIREGDLEVTICPAVEIFPDSNYRQDIKQCRSIIHAKAFHIDDIKDNWGVSVLPEEVTATKLQRTALGSGGLGYGLGGYSYNIARLEKHAVVKEYWERPTQKHPDGRLIIICSDKLLYYGPLPYPVGKDGKKALPFTKVDLIERAGIFWGKTMVERLISVQRRYNALRNRKAEFLSRCAIGQWWVEEDSTDMDILEENVGSPGFIGTYARGSKAPVLSQNPQLPVAFDTEEAALLQEFNVLSGVSDLSRQSKAPPGVKSGVALSIALEQDDTRLSATASNIEDFIIQNGRMWLRLYKNFSDGIRTLRTIGDNNMVELIDWTGSDITSDDVIVEAFSAMAESPAQRRQLVFDLLATGLFHDPETGQITKDMRSKILDMIDLGTWEAADDTEQMHMARADRENLMLEEGHPQMVKPYDDQLLHIARHNKHRLTLEYEALMEQYPQIDQVFQEHVDQHLQYLVPQPEAGQPAPGPAPQGPAPQGPAPQGQEGF